MENKQRSFSVGYFIAMLIALFLIQSVLFAPHSENLSYSEFKTLVKKGEVSNLVLDKQTISAAASGTVTEASIKALERRLGVGSIPSNLRPDVIRADLPSRIDAVNRIVLPLRRAQVIRDLCVIACAGGRLDEVKLTVIRKIARAVSVDETVITCSTEVSRTGSCGACASGNERTSAAVVRERRSVALAREQPRDDVLVRSYWGSRRSPQVGGVTTWPFRSSS